MKQFIDQMGRLVALPHPTKRIISIVPSQTELLFDLGLTDEIVGITKFCIYPNAMFRSKPRIGGTKQINFEKVASLKPDLIIGNKEENQQEQIEELIKHYPVWMSDIKTLADSIDMIQKLGELVNKPAEAFQISTAIMEGFKTFNHKQLKKRSVAYFIWNNPIMTIGKDTFIHEMLNICGFSNVFQDMTRYPMINEDVLQKVEPEFIFLSSEPYPFKEQHIQHFQSICPNAHICLVDGEMFSWYGSRLLHAPNYFKQLAHQCFLLDG